MSPPFPLWSFGNLDSEEVVQWGSFFFPFKLICFEEIPMLLFGVEKLCFEGFKSRPFISFLDICASRSVNRLCSEACFSKISVLNRFLCFYLVKKKKKTNTPF